MSTKSRSSSSSVPTPDQLTFKAAAQVGDLLEADWTVKEEAAAKRKVDLIVLPLLILGFFGLQLDRGNISNALTDFFFRDVGITQDQFNIGQQLLSVGIVLLEIPSNIVLYRYGPQKWISCQVFVWGLISMFQAFQNSFGSFLATRLLLGMAESGFIPGSLYVLTTWYTRKETAKRTMIFFLGNLGASASSNLMAYGILHMRGVAGRPGWFWLFVLEGIFTCVVAIIFALFLPDSTDKPTPLLLPKLTYFTERELHILKYRVILDDPTKGQRRPHLHIRHVWQTLKQPFVWPHVLITLFNNTPLTAFGTYTPRIIASLGYERLKSNAMSSVGLWLALPAAVLFSWISDRFTLRAETTIAALSINAIILLVNRQLGYHANNKGGRYAAIVLVQMINFLAHPLNIAWFSLNCRSSEERASAMAFIIMAANAAGIAGSQLFRSDDAPLYHKGLTACLSIVLGALVIAIGLALYYRQKRKQNRLAGILEPWEKDAQGRAAGLSRESQDLKEETKTIPYV